MITEDLNVARLIELERNGPLDRSSFPPSWEVPFYLRRNAGVTRKLPIGMPAG